MSKLHANFEIKMHMPIETITLNPKSKISKVHLLDWQFNSFRGRLL